MHSRDILLQMKQQLHQRFGSRLVSIIIFGSEARGTAAMDSDIDILLVLNDPIALGVDLDIVISETYSLQLQTDRQFHFSIASNTDYDAGKYALYRTCKKEGVIA